MSTIQLIILCATTIVVVALWTTRWHSIWQMRSGVEMQRMAVTSEIAKTQPVPYFFKERDPLATWPETDEPPDPPEAPEPPEREEES